MTAAAAACVSNKMKSLGYLLFGAVCVYALTTATADLRQDVVVAGGPSFYHETPPVIPYIPTVSGDDHEVILAQAEPVLPPQLPTADITSVADKTTDTPAVAKLVVTTSQGGEVPAIWPLGFPIDLDLSKSTKGPTPDATKIIVRPEFIGSRVIRPAKDMYIIGTGLDEVTVDIIVVGAYGDTVDVWEKKIRCVKDINNPDPEPNPDNPKPNPQPDNPKPDNVVDPDLAIPMVKSIVGVWKTFKPTPTTTDKSLALSASKVFSATAEKIEKAIKAQDEGLTDDSVDLGYLLNAVVLKRLSTELATALGSEYPAWKDAMLTEAIGKTLDAEEDATPGGIIKPARYAELYRQAAKGFEKLAK